jgi:hypothetical protein
MSSQVDQSLSGQISGFLGMKVCGLVMAPQFEGADCAPRISKNSLANVIRTEAGFTSAMFAQVSLLPW